MACISGEKGEVQASHSSVWNHLDLEQLWILWSAIGLALGHVFVIFKYSAVLVFPIASQQVQQLWLHPPISARRCLQLARQVKTYDTGDFFGEIALLLGEPRKVDKWSTVKWKQCTSNEVSIRFHHSWHIERYWNNPILPIAKWWARSGKMQQIIQTCSWKREREKERQREEKSTEKTSSSSSSSVCDATCNAVTFFASRAAIGSNSSLFLDLKACCHCHLSHLNLASPQASIYAKGEVTCLVITKAVFDRVRSVERSVMEGSLLRLSIQPLVEAYSQSFANMMTTGWPAKLNKTIQNVWIHMRKLWMSWGIAGCESRDSKVFQLSATCRPSRCSSGA